MHASVKNIKKNSIYMDIKIKNLKENIFLNANK